MFKNILIFTTGAAIGSVVTWKLLEKKYKDLADEEIESVKEVFKNRNSEPAIRKEEKITKTTTVVEEEVQEESEGIISNGEIVNYSKIVKSEKYDSKEEVDEDDNEDNYTVNTENDPEDRTIPYVIEPEDFGSIPHYGTKTLTYYADDILVDEIDQIINDRDDMIGPDALTHFGEYEDDAVHIRDIDNEMDYEILKSDLSFNSDISSQNGD